MNSSPGPTIFRLSALLLLAALGACEGELMPEGGYAKVANRERDPITRPSAPNPPPVVGGIGGAAGGATPVLAAAATPPGVSQAMVEEGQQLYGTVCSACHGAAGAGSQIAPQLDDGEWLNVSGAYDEIVNVIHTGVANPVQYPGAMPPLGGGNFNEEQVRALAAYVFALSNQEGA